MDPFIQFLLVGNCDINAAFWDCKKSAMLGAFNVVFYTTIIPSGVVLRLLGRPSLTGYCYCYYHYHYWCWY